MGKYIYVLTNYGEYGLESPTVSTMDRTNLLSLLDQKWEGWLDVDRLALLNALDMSDEDLAKESPIDLSNSWGGPLFYIMPVL